MTESPNLKPEKVASYTAKYEYIRSSARYTLQQFVMPRRRANYPDVARSEDIASAERAFQQLLNEEAAANQSANEGGTGNQPFPPILDENEAAIVFGFTAPASSPIIQEQEARAAPQPPPSRKRKRHEEDARHMQVPVLYNPNHFRLLEEQASFFSSRRKARTETGASDAISNVTVGSDSGVRSAVVVEVTDEIARNECYLAPLALLQGLARKHGSIDRALRLARQRTSKILDSLAVLFLLDATNSAVVSYVTREDLLSLIQTRLQAFVYIHGWSLADFFCTLPCLVSSPRHLLFKSSRASDSDFLLTIGIILLFSFLYSGRS
uniref:Uncharacterized protein n=1 Tax=Palpitomonas bilix TaxID=652834 RepID=A0A7S3DLF1_9EUKA